eukprot:jgi/Orpsp1_1/1178823/evm.model.c7180000066857.1
MHRKSSEVEEKKKIFFNENEFYGVTFEKPEKEEIKEIKKKNKTDNKSKKLTKKLREHQGDIFIEALTKCINKESSTGESEEPESNDSQLNNVSTIPTSKTMRSFHEQPKMMWDATDVFPVGIGESEGLDVFRIEDLGLSMVDSDDYGAFSTGDCYVILNTYWEDRELKHKIYQWIGKMAEKDKLFCSAIYSVMLKGFINETSNISREIEGEESDDLKYIFGSEIRYLDYSECAESRLSSPYEFQYPLRMYKIYGNGKIHLVESSHLMFDTNSVFLIDAGLELYQWNGKNSSFINKAFCRILLKRINSNDRKGKAEIIEFEEFEEDTSFWELFDEQRTEENAEEFSNIIMENEKNKEVFKVAKQPIKLYKIPDVESLDDVDCEDYLEEEGYFLNKNLLNSENCYVMDCGVELFLWTGNRASEESRDLIQEFTVKLIPNKVRPNWVGLQRFNENNESELFAIRFYNWDIPEDHDSSKLILSDNCYKGTLKIDARDLYNTSSKDYNNENISQLTKTMNEANEDLLAMHGFVFDPISCNFIDIAETEVGQFYSKNSYIFLCIYKAKEKEDEDSENEEEDSEYDSENENTSTSKSHTIIGKKKTFNHRINCIVYFWQGTMANRFAWLAFLYLKKDQIEQSTLAAYNEPLHVKILNQGSELPYFLSHLNNYCVYFKNSRLNYYNQANITNPLSYSCSNENLNFEEDDEIDHSKIYKKQPLRMFHIQTNQQYKTTRAWEVDIKAQSLVSRDCFLVIYNNLDFISKEFYEEDSECNYSSENGSCDNNNESTKDIDNIDENEKTENTVIIENVCPTIDENGESNETIEKSNDETNEQQIEIVENSIENANNEETIENPSNEQLIENKEIKEIKEIKENIENIESVESIENNENKKVEIVENVESDPDKQKFESISKTITGQQNNKSKKR